MPPERGVAGVEFGLVAPSDGDGFVGAVGGRRLICGIRGGGVGVGVGLLFGEGAPLAAADEEPDEEWDEEEGEGADGDAGDGAGGEAGWGGGGVVGGGGVRGVGGGEDGDEVLRDGRVGVEGLGEGEVGAVVVDGQVSMGFQDLVSAGCWSAEDEGGLRCLEECSSKGVLCVVCGSFKGKVARCPVQEGKVADGKVERCVR